MSGRGVLRVAVATGSRAEFGLLRPVMGAIGHRPELELRVVVAGAHLLEPEETWRDVASAGFEIAARVEMQRTADRDRLDDAAALGRGVEAFARAWRAIGPDWVLVLGDRVEAMAAGLAASIGGIALAHVHGGDRAEGIADEQMRHALAKLAQLHLPATAQSAERLVRMGEDPWRVRVVGSPAIDGLDDLAPMDDDDARNLGDPLAVVLLHPAGLNEAQERAGARALCEGVARVIAGPRVLVMAPNRDPGRAWVLEELEREARARGWSTADHMPRDQFVALLRRLSARAGLLAGNSSAGLIEAAALGLPAVNVGPRQGGRERPNNVIDVPIVPGESESETAQRIAEACERARDLPRAAILHPYGDGHAGQRIAAALADMDPRDPALLRKRNTY